MCVTDWTNAIAREFDGVRSCVVAFSAGVDSAVVARAAFDALGDKAVAVTAVSESLAEGEIEIARRVAESIGIRHAVISTNEVHQPHYKQNAPDRCFHCKSILYSRLADYAREHGLETIANGSNADDTGDFRPGLKAAAEFQVRSPLAACGLNKQQVRAVAKAWGLEVWNKPAMPCLSSRIVYGLEVTPERLKRVDAAEQMLRDLGFSEVRVRCHHNDLARIELPMERLHELGEPLLRSTIIDYCRELGFKYVTIDIEGFRSGSFKQLVPAEVLDEFSSEA